MTNLQSSQRKILMRQAAIIAAIGAGCAMYFVISWMMLCGAAFYHKMKNESRTVLKKYKTSHHNRSENTTSTVYESDTERSSSMETDDSHDDEDVPLPDELKDTASSKHERDKEKDFTEFFVVLTAELTDSLKDFGQTLGEKLKEVGDNGKKAACDRMDRVVTQTRSLPGLSREERLKAMWVIGESASLSRMFDRLDEEGKIRMVQLVANGSISKAR